MALASRQQYLLVDPTTQPLDTMFHAAPRLPDMTNKRLGLIDDSKENAQELLEELTAVLRQRFGIARVVYHRKPSASKPAAPEVIQELAQTCDYVIVAIGSWGSCSACSVHDGIHVEQAGIPAVTICTDIFVETSRAMASMWGAQDYPIIFTQHPISQLTREQLRSRAQMMLEQIVTIVTGNPGAR